MRGAMAMCAAAALVAALATSGAAWAQAGGTATPTTAVKETPPPNYIKSNVDELSRGPAQYEGRFVQLADVFGAVVERFPGGLGRFGVTPQTHYAFRTQRALGSNMLCVAARDNKDAQAFFDTPLNADMEIYLMGKVGPMIDAGDAVVPIFFIDRVVRGATPPPIVRKAEKKPLIMTVEKVVGNTYVKVQDYQFPEPGKKYMIEDPYDKTKKIYVTFQF